MVMAARTSTFRYLIERIFNLLDHVMGPAQKSWAHTLRAIAIMVTLLLPLMFVAALAFPQGKTALHAVGAVTGKYGLPVSALGALVLLVRLAWRKAVKAYRRGQQRKRTRQREMQINTTGAASPTDRKPELGSAPVVNTDPTAAPEPAAGESEHEISEATRHHGDADRDSNLDQPR